jgi:hypothetical protein
LVTVAGVGIVMSAAVWHGWGETNTHRDRFVDAYVTGLAGTRISNQDARCLAQATVEAIGATRTATTGEVDDDVETSKATESTGSTESTESTGSDSGTAGGGEPQDEAIDVNLRTPEGVTLTLSRLSFDSGDILVEAEVVNGSTYDITFHPRAGYDTALRLMDDAGQVYPFIETTEGEDCSPYICDDGLDLAPGERIGGLLAFRGPLFGEPSRLTLITNLDSENAAGFDVANQTDPYYPAFVVPMDLTWA